MKFNISPNLLTRRTDARTHHVYKIKHWILLLILISTLSQSAFSFTYSCLQESCGGLCYSFTSPFPSGTPVKWKFGDFSPEIITTDVTVTHCYTNVNTYSNFNTTPTVLLTNLTNQTVQSTTLDHNNCQHGIFIGDVNGASSNLSLYTALPGSSFNGTNNSKNVYVYGTVVIDKNFTFNATNLYMMPSTGLDITTSVSGLPYELRLEGSTIIDAKPGCNCMWRGIEIEGGSLFMTTNTTLRNALYAIATRTKKTLEISDSHFINNYIGIVGYGGTGGFSMNFTLKGSDFSSNGSLLTWCGGQTIFVDPFHPSDGFFSPDRGWAGIYLEGVYAKYLGQAGIVVNSFSELANGIVIINSDIGKISTNGTLSAGLGNCKFNQIKRGGYPVSSGGFGVYFKDNQGGHFLRQTGFGLNSSPSFDNCEVGIFGMYPNLSTSTQIVSTDNYMTNMESGYELRSPFGSMKAQITSNRIISNQYLGHGISPNGFMVPWTFGVWAKMGSQSSSTNIKVSDNFITINQSDGGAHGIRVEKDVQNTAVGGVIEIKNNDVTVVDKGYGISPYALGGSLTQDNIIHVGDNSSSGGILLANGLGNSVICNDIYGPIGVADPVNNIPAQRGIYASISTDMNIRDNHITNFDLALGVDGNCGTADIACNSFLGDNAYALFYSGGATTGNQLDKGNVFDCTSTGFEAYSISAITPSQKYTAQMGTDAFPDTWFPSTFYEDSDNQPNCPSNPNCDLTDVVAELTPTDIAIAQDQFTIFPGIINSAKQNLYRKLVENPSLQTGNALMQSFVSTNQNGPVGQFYSLLQSIQDLANVPTTEQAPLDANLAHIALDFETMTDLEVQLAANPPEQEYVALLQQYNQLALEIEGLYAANDAILATLQNNRITLANNLLAQNNAINAISVIDINQKQVFDIFLQTIGKGNIDVTPAQLVVLEGIAAQCPEESGIGVLGAISLHRALTNSNLQILDCGIEQRTNEISQPVQVTANLGLYPNPTNGICSVSYQLAVGQVCDLTVFDALGKPVAHYLLDSESGKIQIDDLITGMYFVRLSVGGHVLQTEKLFKF